jgi:hypothetical protein
MRLLDASPSTPVMEMFSSNFFPGPQVFVVLRHSMYDPPNRTRKMANHAIHPVANATSHPDERPLTTEPMNAESMELNALAAGVSVHPARSLSIFGEVWRSTISCIEM